MQRYKPPVIIDEIQYATELLPYIKMAVDKSKRNGDYWLTGSQAFHLMKNISETLAGRVGILNLLGLSSDEINGVESVPFNTDSDRLMSRVPKVPKMELADEMSFLNFMTVVAARTSKPVIYEELASETGISAPTAKKWLSILVSSQVIAIVQPYLNHALKRVTKMPLMHFLDTGLCAYLLKWNNPEALEKGAMSGAFFESYVFSEIYKSYLNKGKEPPIFYYRDKDKKEIDLLLYENGTLYPIEIKKSASPGKGAIKNFDVLKPVTQPEKFGGLKGLKTNIGTGAVICLANDILPIDGKNWYVPVWLI